MRGWDYVVFVQIDIVVLMVLVVLEYYIKLCASFQIHWWNQTGITVRKGSTWVKISDILSRVTLKFDGWHWKIVGHFFFTTPSFVRYFKAIDEFKLELQSGNSQFGSKSAIFCPVWPQNLTMDLEKQQDTSSMLLQVLYIISQPSVNSSLSYSPETLNSGQNRWFFVQCDLEIWWMPSKNYRTPLLYHAKLCASFQSHWWIQTWVTVRKRSVRVKIGVICPVWPWNLTDDLEKQ